MSHYTPAYVKNSLTAIEAVRKVHAIMVHSYGKVACKECGQLFPCRTIRILDGEQ